MKFDRLNYLTAFKIGMKVKYKFSKIVGTITDIYVGKNIIHIYYASSGHYIYGPYQSEQIQRIYE